MSTSNVINFWRTLLLYCIIFILGFKQIMAIRPLEFETNQQVILRGLVFSALPKGQYRPSKASPCTFIPIKGKGRCTFEVNSNNVNNNNNNVAFVVHDHEQQKT
ncbi:hypothetical protein RND81_04G029600 [Saponaria officinalis]|uniref:Uncharacterized protein n=1 Tax=Saponaria officinalis TaxID=3572 RepID=A0AAW1LFW2_SAPOF